jgi:hypothetical protein
MATFWVIGRRPPVAAVVALALIPTLVPAGGGDGAVLVALSLNHDRHGLSAMLREQRKGPDG